MINGLLEIRNDVKAKAPLIHCLTNHITINDCANVVLEVGGKPIMAEHQKEVEAITAQANGLVINLGNITDDKMAAIRLSGRVAKEKMIPSIIDVVGVGCSELRLKFSKEYMTECRPNVIKGNISEIKALVGIQHHAKGIDAGPEDKLVKGNLDQGVNMAISLSKKTKAIVMITGKVDIVAHGEDVIMIENGCSMLSQITGSGCMLNAIIGTYISSGKFFEAAILGGVILGICGEQAAVAKGTGSFRTLLHDSLYTITDERIIEKIKVRSYR
jgi:hydroxyethylthiazole kinase